jgi:hypothetical protein
VEIARHVRRQPKGAGSEPTMHEPEPSCLQVLTGEKAQQITLEPSALGERVGIADELRSR